MDIRVMNIGDAIEECRRSPYDSSRIIVLPNKLVDSYEVRSANSEEDLIKRISSEIIFPEIVEEVSNDILNQNLSRTHIVNLELQNVINSQLGHIQGHSSIQILTGNTTYVCSLRDSSSIVKVSKGSTLGLMYGGARVEGVYDSTVDVMRGESSINISRNSRVNEIHELARVGAVYGGSLGYVCDRANIGGLFDQSSLGVLIGEASVGQVVRASIDNVWKFAKIGPTTKGAKINFDNRSGI